MAQSTVCFKLMILLYEYFNSFKTKITLLMTRATNYVAQWNFIVFSYRQTILSSFRMLSFVLRSTMPLITISIEPLYCFGKAWLYFRREYITMNAPSILCLRNRKELDRSFFPTSVNKSIKCIKMSVVILTRQVTISKIWNT